jgi:hypothetical protein
LGKSASSGKILPAGWENENPLYRQFMLPLSSCSWSNTCFMNTKPKQERRLTIIISLISICLLTILLALIIFGL